MVMTVRRHSSGAWRVPHHGGVVVVAVGAQRPAEAGVVFLVPLAAGDPPPVRAVAGFAAGSAPGDLARPGVMTRVWTGPKEGAVKVANTHGWMATDSGTPLPPASPARMSW